MSYDENRISDQIEGGLLQKEELDREMFGRLVSSHFNLFRRLNQIKNKSIQPNLIEESLKEAKEVNRYFSDNDSFEITQS